MKLKNLFNKLAICLFSTVLISDVSFCSEKKEMKACAGFYFSGWNAAGFDSNSDLRTNQFARFTEDEKSADGWFLSYLIRSNIRLVIDSMSYEQGNSRSDAIGIPLFGINYSGENLNLSIRPRTVYLQFLSQKSESQSFYGGLGLSRISISGEYNVSSITSPSFYNLHFSKREVFPYICAGLSKKLGRDGSLFFELGRYMGNTSLEFALGDFTGSYFTDNTVRLNETNARNADGLTYDFGGFLLKAGVSFNFDI